MQQSSINMQVLSMPTGFDSLHRGPHIEAPCFLCTAADSLNHLIHPSTLCLVRPGMGTTYANPATEALNGRVAHYIAGAGLRCSNSFNILAPGSWTCQAGL